MKLKRISNGEKADKAIVLFLGWGMDSNPFADIEFDGYDIVAIWDYSDDDIDVDSIRNYTELIVVAWSFGVFNAQRFIESHFDKLPAISLRIAINGTLHPIDSERGINPAIFNATLENLSEASLSKFQLRMCGNRSSFANFIAKKPHRSIDDLRRELSRIGELKYNIADSVEHRRKWDYAVIGSKDLIFTPEAQKRSWDDCVQLIEIEAPHYVDIQRVINSLIFNKRLVAQRFKASVKTYTENAVVQNNMTEQLANMLPQSSKFENALEIGSGNGWFTDKLLSHFVIRNLRMWDLVSQFPGVEECDAEIAIRNQPDLSFDLIASSSTFQWFNSPLRFLRECYRASKRGGVLAFSTFGDYNFRELNGIVNLPMRYKTLGEWEQMVQKSGWHIISSHEENVVLEFESPIEVMRHFKLTGVNGMSLNGKNVTTVRSIISQFPISDGKACLTYHPIYIIAKK